MNGITTIISYKNNQYLVSVGISDLDDNSLESKLKAIKTSKILAKSELSKFINDIQSKSKEELIDKTIIIKNGDKIKRRIESKYIELINEQSKGILKNIFNIGRWKRNNEYFYAIGIKIIPYSKKLN